MPSPDRLAELLGELGASAPKLREPGRLLAPLVSLTPLVSRRVDADWRHRRVLCAEVELVEGLDTASAAYHDLQAFWRAHAEPLPDWDGQAGDGRDGGGRPVPIDDESAARLERVDALLADLRRERAARPRRLRGQVSFSGLRGLLEHPLVAACAPVAVYWPSTGGADRRGAS